jgi:perosamine synthetase
VIHLSKPFIDYEEILAVTKVMNSGQLAQGSVVTEFEDAFSEHFDFKYSAAVNNGTSGLHVALKAVGIKKGDKVLTTPFSFIATTNAILYCGGIPCFVDIDGNTFNLSADKLKEEVSNHPDAKFLLITHIFGQSCEMDRIMDIVKEHELVLIEDCCQAHGAMYKEKPVGSFGTAGVFSFYPTKNMTTGEGGMITSSDEGFIQKCKLLINHGSQKRYHHHVTGYNYRMTEIAASIGLVQLKKLEYMNRQRQSNARFYLENIKNEFVSLPVLLKKNVHVFNQFTLKTNHRDELIDYLLKHNIQTSIFYPKLISQQPNVLDYLSNTVNKLLEAEKVVDSVLSIPVHPSLSQEQLEYICKIINQFVPKSKKVMIRSLTEDVLT